MSPRSPSDSSIRFTVDGDGRWTIVDCRYDLDAFIREGLRLEERITRKLRTFSNRASNATVSSDETVEKFCEHEGFSRGFWIDTATGPNLVLPHARYFKVKDLIFLQPSAPCGDLKPKVYSDPTDWMSRNAFAVLSSAPSDAAGAELFPELPLVEPHWVTDDAGETWQAGSGEYNDLTDYEGTTDPKERGRGKLFVGAGGHGFCPLTGDELNVSFFHGDPDAIPSWR